MKHLPNLITSLNLFTGAVGIVLILGGNLVFGFYCVLIAGLFDFLDGFVARILGVSSPIGKELDSLADVVSFGLLPAVLMMQLLDPLISNPYLHFLGLMIVVFSALRLAKFNIDENQTDKFIGLPTPANAIMITSLVLLPDQWLNLPFLAIVTIFSCGMLVAPLEMMALKFKNYGWAGNEMKYLMTITTVVLLVTVGVKVIPFVIPIYISFSFVGNYFFKTSF